MTFFLNIFHTSGSRFPPSIKKVWLFLSLVRYAVGVPLSLNLTPDARVTAGQYDRHLLLDVKPSLPPYGHAAAETQQLFFTHSHTHTHTHTHIHTHTTWHCVLPDQRVNIDLVLTHISAYT